MSSGAVDYVVFPTTDEMWQFLAEKWSAVTRRSTEKKGYCAVAISGGKTPAGFYQRLPLIQALPWDKTHIFFADERFVPSDSPESNYAMAQKTLLSKVPIPRENVHPVSTEKPSAREAAE